MIGAVGMGTRGGEKGSDVWYPSSKDEESGCKVVVNQNRSRKAGNAFQQMKSVKKG